MRAPELVTSTYAKTFLRIETRNSLFALSVSILSRVRERSPQRFLLTKLLERSRIHLDLTIAISTVEVGVNRHIPTVENSVKVRFNPTIYIFQTIRHHPPVLLGAAV